MQIVPMHLHKNNLITQYRNHDPDLMKHFNYEPFGSLHKRYEYVMTQPYNREQLADVLRACNQEWGSSAATIEAIDRLTDPEAVTVVGGQQAGLLTGPLYTVNKIISIILYAREQEEILGKTVIPVFWIAGEDHDYDEINHLFTLEKMELQKKIVKQKVLQKKSLSTVKMDKAFVTEWMNDIFQTIMETNYTKDVYATLTRCLEQSETYVDFFARLIHALFKNSGLVLIDSGDKRIRDLEKEMFVRLIQHQKEIARTAFDTKVALEEKGHAIPLELEEEDAHLFYHDSNGERILLKREEEDWVGKLNEVHLRTDGLLQELEENPENFSNNVVTRPLMQEFLFPTLAFIAGDGEITYWATLKEAFTAVDMEMPPVIPRLSFTFVTKHMEKLAANREMTIEDIIQNGTAEAREQWLANQDDASIDKLIQDVWQGIKQAHAPIREWGHNFSSDMKGLTEKNQEKLKQQIQFMEGRMKQALAEKYAFELDEFKEIEHLLHPKDGLQERVWTPLSLLNKYGVTWIDEMIQQNISFEKNHYTIYLDQPSIE